MTFLMTTIRRHAAKTIVLVGMLMVLLSWLVLWGADGWASALVGAFASFGGMLWALGLEEIRHMKGVSHG